MPRAREVAAGRRSSRESPAKGIYGRDQAFHITHAAPRTTDRPRSGGVCEDARLAHMRIVVLAGGIGGARFLRGLKVAVPDAEITVIGNTGDDITLFGLRVCPDLDTVMYTLGAGINEEQGWGRADESFTVQRELAAYGAGTDWFALGDRD